MDGVTRERDTFAWDGGTVSGVWHHPAADAATCVALTHGAAGTIETPQLRAVADALAAAGIAAVRFNLPAAEAGRRSPDRMPVAASCVRAVAEQVATRARRVVLGGRSFGGRVASHVVADGWPAAGLVFLAYPLHPPGKPERLRDEHLDAIEPPMLFLQGDRDPFARPDLLARVVERLPRATVHVVEGGDHSHAVRGRPAADVHAELAGAIGRWLAELP